MRLGRFKRKNEVRATVPTASMADIAFLLLIFFMATTIFKMQEGLDVVLPRAETATRQSREGIVHVWVDRSGRVSINDRLMRVDQIRDIVKGLLVEEPGLVVALNADERAPYKAVSAVMEELKDANAVRVSFTTDKKAAGVKRRSE